MFPHLCPCKRRSTNICKMTGLCWLYDTFTKQCVIYKYMNSISLKCYVSVLCCCVFTDDTHACTHTSTYWSPAKRSETSHTFMSRKQRLPQCCFVSNKDIISPLCSSWHLGPFCFHKNCIATLRMHCLQNKIIYYNKQPINKKSIWDSQKYLAQNVNEFLKSSEVKQIEKLKNVK